MTHTLNKLLKRFEISNFTKKQSIKKKQLEMCEQVRQHTTLKNLFSFCIMYKTDKI